MEWKATYEIGIPEIDDHHMRILGMISEFETAAVTKMHWNIVQPLLLQTREFAKFHFAVEESLMQIVKYPAYDEHRAEHQQVLTQIGDMERGVLRQSLKEEMLPLLRTWLFDHIVSSDKNFSVWVLARYPSIANSV